MTFPQIVGKLIDDGFESYTVDYRRATATYYRPDGDSVEFPTHSHAVAIAEAFDAGAVKAAIKEAQQLVHGYTSGFLQKSDVCRMCGLHRVIQRPTRSVFRPHG